MLAINGRVGGRLKRLACLLTFSCFAIAQDEPPSFRTGTRLVQVDVIVRGALAAPLTKNDFELSDNGKRQEIAIFSVREADALHSAPKLPPGMVSNRPVATGREPVAATVLMIDRLNTDFADQAYARDQAMKYLERTGRREPIAIYSLNQTLKVVQSFTDDPDLLHQAIERASSEPPAGDLGILDGLKGNAVNATIANVLQRRADITTAAFHTVSRNLRGLPGRKKLVWITAALPLTYTQTNERNGVAIEEFQNLSPALFAATRVLNDANIAIYTIDPRGLCPGCSLSDPNITAMIRLSEMTGGTAFYMNNDLTVGLDRAVSDTDLTYTLGFYPSEDELDGSFHSLSVKVLRPGIEARSRKGYSASQPSKPLTEKQRTGTLNAWVHEPLDASDIAVTARASRLANRPGYYSVEVVVDLSAIHLENSKGRWKGTIDLAVTPETSGKRKGLKQTIDINLTEDRLAGAMARGLTIANPIKATNAKGKLLSKNLKVVVMDRANGNAGSVRIPLE